MHTYTAHCSQVRVRPLLPKEYERGDEARTAPQGSGEGNILRVDAHHERALRGITGKVCLCSCVAYEGAAAQHPFTRHSSSGRLSCCDEVSCEAVALQVSVDVLSDGATIQIAETDEGAQKR